MVAAAHVSRHNLDDITSTRHAAFEWQIHQAAAAQGYTIPAAVAAKLLWHC